MTVRTAIRRLIQIKNRLGIHARPAAMFAECAGHYRSDIRVLKDGFEANAKSVLNVMMLAAEFGSTLEIVADGDDADAAVDSLAALVESKFGEEA
jgi:phosphocarrier protein